jgi:hypothetical protein
MFLLLIWAASFMSFPVSDTNDYKLILAQYAAYKKSEILIQFSASHAKLVLLSDTKITKIMSIRVGRLWSMAL